jgi:hypothetical protein
MSNTYSPSLGLPLQCKEWKTNSLMQGNLHYLKTCHELSSHEGNLISKTLTNLMSSMINEKSFLL